MEYYQQGQIHTSEDGTKYQFSGNEWVPVSKTQSNPNPVTSSLGLLAEGVAGFPQDVIRTGATLSAGASDLLQGRLPNWESARQQYAPEANPVVEAFGYPKRAVSDALRASGIDTGTSPLAEGLQAIVDPLAQAVGPLSAASKTALDVLGVGAGFLAPKVPLPSVPAGMSGMAARVVQQADPMLRKYAPRYTGVNQEIEAGMDAISQQAAKAVGLGDGVPLTAKGLATARETTKAGYDDLFSKLGVAGGVNVPVAGLVDDIKIALSDSGAISPIAQKAADKAIADFIPANATSLTAEELHKIQSAIGKQANDYRSAGKNVKADVLDTVHTSLLNRFTDELGTVYPTLVPELSKLRSQYHAQAVLNRAGVIASEGNLNIPTLYRATQKIGNNPELAQLGVMARDMKDIGGIKTSQGLAEQLTSKGVGAFLGAVGFGGIPGALAGALLEPAVARGFSFVYPKAVSGMSGMATRMRSLSSTLPSAAYVNPNAGKFGQGGGIGGFKKATPDEEFSLATWSLTPEQQARLDAYRATQPPKAEARQAPSVSYNVTPEGKYQAAVSKQQQQEAAAQARFDARAKKQAAIDKVISDKLASELRAQEIEATKQYSLWQQSLVPKQTEIADEMLARFNPKDKASKQYKEKKGK